MKAKRTAQMMLHAKITCRVTLSQVMLPGHSTKINVTHLQLQLVKLCQVIFTKHVQQQRIHLSTE